MEQDFEIKIIIFLDWLSTKAEEIQNLWKLREKMFSCLSQKQSCKMYATVSPEFELNSSISVFFIDNPYTILTWRKSSWQLYRNWYTMTGYSEW